MIVTKRAAVTAIAVAALGGTALWLSTQGPPAPATRGISQLPTVSGHAHPSSAGAPQTDHEPLARNTARQAALPKEPEPLPVIDPFAGDMDGDGRLSVEEWFALEHRPSVPRYWTDDELMEWSERWKAMKSYASGSADPYAYYDDETKIALARAGDERAKRELLHLYSKTGRVEELKLALLARIDPSDPDLARQFRTIAYNWYRRQPLLAAAFFGAAEELRAADPSAPDVREEMAAKAQQAGISYEQMRQAGRDLLAQLDEGGAP